MPARSSIIAGKTVIVVEVQEAVDASLRTIRSKVLKFSNQINRIGLDLFRGGILPTIGLGLVVKEFTNFEDQMLTLQARSKATQTELASMEERIRSLGRTTSFTALQVAQGATELAKAAFSPAEIERSLQSVLDLARGTDIGLDAAASLIANTMKTFALTPEDTGTIASQFVAAARLGTLDVIDLKEAIKEVSGTLRSLNVDLPTTLGLLNTLSFSSLKGTKAGTSLNTAILNIGQNLEQLREAGIEFGDPKNVPLVDILDQIIMRANALGAFERTATLQDIFNIRGGRAVTAIAIQDVQLLRNTIQEIRDSATEARDAAALMDSKLGGATRRLTSAFNDLVLSIGKIASGPLTQLFEGLTNVLNKVDLLANRNPELVLTIAALGPAALAAGAGLLTLSFVLSRLAFMTAPIGALTSGLLSLVSAGAAAPVSAFKKLTSPSGVGGLFAGMQRGLGKGFTAAQLKKATTSARMGAKLGSVLKTEIQAGAAIRAVGSGLTSVFSKGMKVAGSQGLRRSIWRGTAAAFRGASATPSALKSFYSAFTKPAALKGALLDPIQSGLRGLGGATVRSSMHPIIGGIKDVRGSRGPLNALLRILNSIGNAALKVGSIFGQGLFKGIKTIGPGIRSLLVSITKVNFVGKLASVGKGLWNFTRVLFGVMNAVRRFVFSFSGFLTIIELLIIFGPKIRVVREAFSSIGQAFGAFFREIGKIGGSNTWTLLKGAFTDLISGRGSFEELVDAMKMVGDAVRTYLISAWEQFKAKLEPVLSVIRTLIQSLGALFGLAGNLGKSTFGGFFDDMGGAKVTGAIGSMFNFGLEDVRKAVISVVQVIGGILHSIAQNFSSFLNTMQTLITSFLEKVLAIIQHGANAIGVGFSQTPGFKDMSASFLGFGKVIGDIRGTFSDEVAATNEKFEQRQKDMTKSFDNFTNRLTEILNFTGQSEEAEKQARFASHAAARIELNALKADEQRRFNNFKEMAGSFLEPLLGKDIGGNASRIPGGLIDKALKATQDPEKLTLKIADGLFNIGQAVGEKLGQAINGGIDQQKQQDVSAMRDIVGSQIGSAQSTRRALIQMTKQDVQKDILGELQDMNGKIGSGVFL